MVVLGGDADALVRDFQLPAGVAAELNRAAYAAVVERRVVDIHANDAGFVGGDLLRVDGRNLFGGAGRLQFQFIHRVNLPGRNRRQIRAGVLA